MSSFNRFFAKVDKTDTCWNWTGSLTKSGGYGQFSYESKPVRAHRWIYEQTKVEIPEGYHIDHLCRVHKCVNPDQLEAVTPQENHRRGFAGLINNHHAKKTHCPKGHEYSGKNNKGKRVCRTCATEQTKIYYQRKEHTKQLDWK